MSDRPGSGQTLRLVLLAALCAWPAGQALAQSDPRLAAAVRLAQEGQGDSARAVVERLLGATSPTDSIYPEILLAAATTAASTVDRQRSLQRIVVEYPFSDWADDALLGLAELEYANGNLAAAARGLERLRVDYPSSPLYPSAALWAARTYFDLKDSSAACRWIADGVAHASADVEVQNQLAYYRQRCASVTAQPADSGSAAPDTAAPHRDSTATTPAPPAPGTAGRAAAPTARTIYRVQIAAATSKAAADVAVRRLKAMGVGSVVFRDKGLFKVRGGAYATRAEAARAAARLRARLGGTPFVVADR